MFDIDYIFRTVRCCRCEKNKATVKQLKSLCRTQAIIVYHD